MNLGRKQKETDIRKRDSA